MGMDGMGGMGGMGGLGGMAGMFPGMLLQLQLHSHLVHLQIHLNHRVVVKAQALKHQALVQALLQHRLPVQPQLELLAHSQLVHHKIHLEQCKI